MPAAQHQNGFTLVEVMVSVALFAIISLAGFTMVDAILNAQQRTEGRLERLGDLQQAMMVIEADFSQITGRSFIQSETSVRVERFAAGEPSGTLMVSYSLQDGILLRQVISGTAKVHDQALLTGVSDVDWQYHHDGSWRDELTRMVQGREQWPAAISISVALDPAAGVPHGTVRRVVPLPARVEP